MATEQKESNILDKSLSAVDDSEAANFDNVEEQNLELTTSVNDDSSEKNSVAQTYGDDLVGPKKVRPDTSTLTCSKIEPDDIAKEASVLDDKKNSESEAAGSNDHDEIPEIALSVNNRNHEIETDDNIILKNSEEIVQLVPPVLEEENDKINLDSMKVMCNNFFEEGNHRNDTVDIGEASSSLSSEEIEALAETTENAIDSSTSEVPPMWATKSKKTYNFTIPYSNLSKLMNSNPSIFDDLPDELIVKIFSFLTTEELCLHAAPVCRKWRAISQDHSLWRTLDFSSCPLLSSLNFLWVIRRAPMLQRLILSGRSHITHPEVAIFTECCPLLQEIDFGFCDSLTGEMLHSVSENCSQIKKINVEGCEKMNYNCVRYFIRCKQLTHLNFSHCMGMSDKAVAVLSRGLPNLCSINLDGIDSITDCAVESLVLKHSSHLQEVELDGAEISDLGIQQLSMCPQLKHLELSFCECLTDQALDYLKELKNLENLRLRKASDLSSEGLSTFFKSASLSKLQWLNLSECTNINDQVVLDLVQACGKNLKELSLSWCWFITDTGLVSIMDHCSNMENLDLLGIDKIRGDCFDRIPEEMPKLKYLDLRQCNKIVDSLIVYVVRRKPDLRVWNYYGEEFVHD